MAYNACEITAPLRSLNTAMTLPAFIETSVFTRRVIRLLSPEEYRLLQVFLALHPEAGALIPGSGGLRKLRWSGKGKGKRGGTRLIYYWEPSQGTIYLVFIFAKNERVDLTPYQLRLLREALEKE